MIIWFDITSDYCELKFDEQRNYYLPFYFFQYGCISPWLEELFSFSFSCGCLSSLHAVLEIKLLTKFLKEEIASVGMEVNVFEVIYHFIYTII